MRKLITTIALLAADRHFGGDCSDGWFANPAALHRRARNKQMCLSTGRPPPAARRSVPSEKTLMDPKDPINQENAALDRMINGICRGC